MTKPTPLYQWTSSCSVGVSRFDGQHRHLFEMLNDLNTAMQSGQGKAVLSNILYGLTAYAQDHFAAEELAMKNTSYPEFAAHYKEHVAFALQISKFMEEFEAGATLISIDVLQFLSEWLKKHILGSDKAYAAHLNRHGIR